MASTNNHSFVADKDRSKLFPLKSIADVVKFFRNELESGSEPDLTILSIVAGFIENTLTSGSGSTPASAATANAASVTATIESSQSSSSSNLNTNSNHLQQQQHQQQSDTSGGSSSSTSNSTNNLGKFPLVTYDAVDNLYKKFQNILSVVDKPRASKSANRNVIKKVSDIIWHSLIRSTYKDRAHLQNLYSYLSGNKLDCFGVAFAVVAGCQLLGYKDVHLAISEDHAWVVFGKNRIETVEVTWHGKGHEDKRGQDVSTGVESRSWLYLAGNPVVCDRYMEVAAIVSAINISLTLTSDCLEVADLQQNLLWLLYDMGHLQKYPMGLGNLGELEEVSPTENRPTCEELYKEAIQSAQKYYKNHHVYPYTYQGGYYYRERKYREAFASWANAGDVIRLYNYSRDDEEIYKEFLDIANEMIPHVMKTESSGHSARSILRDSECFANLLRFYDGICLWEEGSLTPILHIGWAKPLVNTISKFDYDIRSQVIINCGKDDDESITGGVKRDVAVIDGKKAKENETESTEQVQMDEGNNNFIKKEEIGKQTEGSGSGGKPTLADLTAACGEKILNPEFLLQGGCQPFAEQKQKKSEGEDEKDDGLTTKMETKIVTSLLEKDILEDKFVSSVDKDKTTVIASAATNASRATTNNQPKLYNDDIFEYKPKRPVITLYSQKMKGLKDLLLAEKLNTHAISLQVTAQSQGAGKKSRHATDKSHSHMAQHNTIQETEACSRPKRTRRE